ncbi:MAG: YkgJ family cysteine cluster protein [Desulfobacteraceae bacterium]|nr:YkgJ family cysteine cluster protein [Desulfobacteraceae bacterium]MCB9494115.1 YkgJ family cysteine cluster protein [Desulfobacteraceae bacterium]
MSSIDPISKNDDILFECKPDSLCGNLCCCGINQTLTGYDILKLSRLKNLTTDKFLKRYTFSYTGKQTKIPVVSLFEQPDKNNACIFLDSSCTVYDARPLSCRLYPVARGISKDKRTGKLIEHFAVINEDQCTGFGKGNYMSVSEWILDQKASDYIEANDFFMNLILDISSKNTVLDKSMKDIFIKGCYNLDLLLEDIRNLQTSIKTDIKELENNPLLLFKTGVEWTRSQILN